MASEVLAIKEELLEEFIDLLERGLNADQEVVSDRLRNCLEGWIEEEREYIKRMNGDDDED